MVRMEFLRPDDLRFAFSGAGWDDSRSLESESPKLKGFNAETIDNDLILSACLFETQNRTMLAKQI